MLHFSKSKRFHLITHSFGCLLALKLAEKLEDLGKVGHITFIDGSPLFLKAMALENFKTHSEEEFQKLIILQVVQVAYCNLDNELLKEVFSEPTWEDKINRITELSSGQNIYGKEYMKLLLTAIRNRTKIVLNSESKICSIEKCSSTLIRAKTTSIKNIDEAYELDQNFTKKVDVMYLDGSHFSILENPELPEVLNKIHSKIEN